MIRLLDRIWLLAVAALLAIALSACASGPRYAFYSFGFDAPADSPDVQILDYRFGDYFRNRPELPAELPTRQALSNSGTMPLGDSLYVKWRIKTTGQVFEDTANLKPLLPWSMDNKRIHFVVQKDRLFVYLSDWDQPRPRESPIVGPFRVQSYLTQQIYPVPTSK